MAPALRHVVWTALALVSFAANSLLCRAALADRAIDPASFTALRLAAGALLLAVVARGRRSRGAARRRRWHSGFWLFAYAAAFSLAYVELSAGTGALLLFGVVQGTMLVGSLASGERPDALAWGGWLTALAGLVTLLLPGWRTPSPLAALTMAGAGVAWGLYSLRGRGDTDPVTATAGNFVGSLPWVAPIVLVAAAFGTLELSPGGALLAVVSGAVTSALGYIAWYTALGGLSAFQAGVVQLSVPLVAAGGGVLLLGEAVSTRQVVATLLLLGGVALAMRRHTRPSAD